MRYDFLSRFLTLCIGLGFSATVLAATSAADLTALPWGQIAVGTILALWGGLTHTAQRLVSTLRAGTPVDRMGYAIAVDLLVSCGNGFVLFLLGAWNEWGVWQLAISLFVGGYAGTRLMDVAVETLMSRLGAAQAVKAPETKDSP